MRILVINGPNLNMLGSREPEIYGALTLDDIQSMSEQAAKANGQTIDFRQSNDEGELVTWIQEAKGAFDALIINAAAYTHTSVAIHDALRLLSIPVVEVHLSNPAAREDFRHISYVAPCASAVIAGCGGHGYVYALTWLSTRQSG